MLCIKPMACFIVALLLGKQNEKPYQMCTLCFEPCSRCCLLLFVSRNHCATMACLKHKFARIVRNPLSEMISRVYAPQKCVVNAPPNARI